MSGEAMPWDPFQRDVLEAMGHVLWSLQDAPPATRDDDASTPPLLRALSRAANVPVAQLPALPPDERLRTPAAKRALWPQLRALRKASRG